MPPISRIRQPPALVVALGATVVFAFAAGLAWTAFREVQAGDGWRAGGAGLFLTVLFGWLGTIIARFAYRLFRMDMEPVATYGVVHRFPFRIAGRTIIGRHRSPPRELIAELGRAAAAHGEIEEIYVGLLMDAAGDGVEKLVVGFVSRGDGEVAVRAIGPELERLVGAGQAVLVVDVGRDQGLLGKHMRAYEKPVWRRRDGSAIEPTPPLPID